jgi:hypothetical protein
MRQRMLAAASPRRTHASAYASTRTHASAYASRRFACVSVCYSHASAYASRRFAASRGAWSLGVAFVSTAYAHVSNAYVSMRQRMRVDEHLLVRQMCARLARLVEIQRGVSADA